MYHASGLVFADVARDLGIPLTEGERELWAGAMRDLVLGDEVIEGGSVAGSVTLAECMGVKADDSLAEVLYELAAASRAAIEAGTLKEHFDARAEEGVLSAELFRAMCPEPYVHLDTAWAELRRVGVAGVMLDSACDASEDLGMFYLNLVPRICS